MAKGLFWFNATDTFPAEETKTPPYNLSLPI